jgi:hypothetical protein
MLDTHIDTELRTVMAISDLLAKGQERLRLAAEAERKQDEESAALMAENYRNRDFETAEAVPEALRLYLVPTPPNLRYLPDTEHFERRVEIPEFSPILVRLVKYLNVWRVANHSLYAHQVKTYLVEKAFLDEVDGDVRYFGDPAENHPFFAYEGHDLELALVAAKAEYQQYLKYSAQLDEMKQRQEIKKKELEYVPADPPIPTDQQALEALKQLVDERIDRKLNHSISGLI